MSAAETLSRVASEIIAVEAAVSSCSPGSGVFTGVRWRGPAATAFAGQVRDTQSQLATARREIEAAARAAYRHEAHMRGLRAAMTGIGGVA